MGLVSELRRRNVLRMAVLYVVAAWLIMQVAEVLIALAKLPDWIGTTTLILLAVGFPIALIFSWFYELTPEGINLEKDVMPGQSMTHVTGRRLDFIVISLLCAAVILFAYDKWWTGPPPEQSIAVLAFENMSADPEQEYFSDGISEEILNALAKVDNLKVTGRTSSFAFKERNEDLKTIGEALGVSHILEGSVRKAGDRIRITAQLIKANDGFHLWSDTYDRELTNVFAIQDEIAQAILKQLKVHLTGEPGDTQLAASTANPEVFDLYLEAKQKIYIRKKVPLEEAAELLDRAIAIDPAYAPAYAQRGISYILLGDANYGTIPVAEALKQAKLMLDRALLLDPESAEAWAGRGLYLLNVRDHDLASEALRRALAINPSLVDARNWLANSLRVAGDIDGSFRVRREVLVRDPLYLPGIDNLLDDYFLYGDIEQAQALVDRVRPYMPATRITALYEGALHFVAGRVAESLPYFDSAVEMEPENQYSKGPFSRALFYSWQNERLAEVGLDEYKVYALMRLDRPDEASILAQKLAVSDNKVAALFRFLVEQERCADLIDYLESRWPSLQAFETDFPERDGWSEHNYMGQIAYCYQRLGNQEKFQGALTRFKAALNYQRQIGANNHWFVFAEAVHAVLAGDHEVALDKLERALEGGFTVNPHLSVTWPMFEPLDRDSRLEAIINRMVEHLNAERAKMGFAPVHNYAGLLK